MQVSHRFKKFIPHLIGLIVVLGCYWLNETQNSVVRNFFKRLEFMIYDVRYRATLPEKPNIKVPIAIIDIDEKSLATEGRWPWSRAKVANLIQGLRDYGAIVIAFDVIFAEPENNMSEAMVNQLRAHQLHNPELELTLNALAPKFDNDMILAKKIGERQDVVLAIVFHPDKEYSKGKLPTSIHTLNESEAQFGTIVGLGGHTSNIDKIQNATPHAGFITTLRDDDGVIRRSPLILRSGNEVYPSLGLVSAQVYLMIEKVNLNFEVSDNQLVISSVQLGEQIIPTDKIGQVIVPYKGTRGAYKYYSASDVLNHKLPPNALKDYLVFVGTTSLGLGDLQTTPVQNIYPGVEIHANIANGIIENYFPTRPAWASQYERVLLVSLGLALSLILPFLGPLTLTLFSILVVVSLVAVNVWVWVDYGLVLSFATTIFETLLLMIVNVAYGFLFENRKGRVLRKAFSQYVPPAHVKEISDNPDAYTFDGESRELTVLFADIRGFTTLSETLDASQLKQLLNRYFTPMTEIIFRCGGTIDKYVGDMIMAFWGAPVEDLQHREHTLEAAICMIEKLENQLNPEFAALGLPEIHIGIGLNTGLMNVGDMGSEFRRAYTVLGDAVNLGSRIEGTTKFYGVRIAVGESTRIEQDKFLFRKLDRVKVKGKHQSVEVSELVCRMREATPELLEEVKQHERGIALYFAQQWHAAYTIFKELNEQHPQTRIYEMLLERIEEFIKNPPPADWDGSYTRSEK